MKTLLQRITTKLAFWMVVLLIVSVFLGGLARVVESVEVIAQVEERKAGALTELQQLKAENHKLKITLAQMQTQLNECTLNRERASLTDEFMKTLGAKPGEFFDWNTLTVKKEQK